MTKENALEVYNKLSDEMRKQYALIGIQYAAELLAKVLELAKKNGLGDLTK